MIYFSNVASGRTRNVSLMWSSYTNDSEIQKTAWPISKSLHLLGF